MRKRSITLLTSVALAWLAAEPATSVPTTSTPVETLRIPHPNLSAVDTSLRQRVEAIQKSLVSQVERWQPGQQAPELAKQFGFLGQLFHAFRLLDAAEDCYLNARRLARNDYRWPHYLGLVLNAKGELARAVGEYDRALELSPDDFPSLIRLGNALLELDHLDRAQQVFEQAGGLQPSSAVMSFGLGKVAARRGDNQTAIRLFESTLTLDPTATIVHYPLAQAYRKIGKVDSAREHLALRGSEDVRFVDPLGTQVVRLATAAAFEIVLSLAHDSGGVGEEEFLGFALSQFGDIKGTIGQLEEGLRLQELAGDEAAPDELARIHYVLGGLMVNDQRDEQAIVSFRHAIELDPSLIDTRIKLGNALARKGLSAEASEVFDAVLLRDPDNRAALLKQAATLMNLERVDEARGHLEELLRLDPKHSEALVRLGAIFERNGQLDEAATLYRSAAALDLRLGEAVQVRYFLAGLLRRRKDLEGALAEYRWAVDADPSYVPAVADLAGLLGQLGRFGQSAELFARWVELEPDRVQPRIGEAAALIANGEHLNARNRLEAGLAAELGDDMLLKDILARHLAACPDESVRDGERALELALEVYEKIPSAESTETVAMAYAQAGRFGEAVEWQQRLLTSGGDPQAAGRLRSNLELYRQGRVCCSPG